MSQPQPSSPIAVAGVRMHSWQPRALSVLVLLTTIAIGGAFVFSTWKLVRDTTMHTMRQTADFGSVLLAQDSRVITMLRQRSHADIPLLTALQKQIAQPALIAVAGQDANQEWIVLDATDDERVGMPAPGPLAVTGATMTISGTLLTAISPIGSGNAPAGLLVIEVPLDPLQTLVMPLALPCLLLLLAGLLMSRAIHAFAKRRQKTMQQEIDQNRLALLELATHQLGAPIATFRWWLELLSDPDNKDIIGNEQVTTQIHDAVDRMEDIIKSLTEANSVESGGITSKREVLASLKHIIQRVAEEMTPHLRTHKQTVEISIAPDVKSVQLDTKLISAVLKELIDNAISYSPDGTRIRIAVTNDRDSARVAVTDQGYGIPESDLPRIFEKFSRASNAPKYKPVGNGLGLFVCKGIIENLGGEMWIESKLNRGTTVSFTLPYEARANRLRPRIF